MPFSFDVWGYEDFDGGRHEIDPLPAGDVGNFDLDDTYGLLVHAYDPENPDDDNWFWAFVGEPFESWEEWYVYIGALADMYGMEVA